MQTEQNGDPSSSACSVSAHIEPAPHTDTSSVFIGCFTIGSTSAIIFQCTPVAAGWDYTLRPPTGTGKCYSATIFKNVGVFNSSVNIFTDLLFALIPIPMVWRLQVNLQTRIGLAVILSLGLFASAVAIYKTPMQANFFAEQDWSGHGSWYYIWQQCVSLRLPPAKVGHLQHRSNALAESK